jgi:protease-4
MNEEEHALLKEMVLDVLLQFKQAIVAGRNLTMAQVTQVADGRIFSGAQAKSLHLVDELGTIQDAIEEAAKQGKIKGKPTVVYSEKKRKGILDFIMEDSGDDGSSASLGKWIRLFSQVLHLADQVGEGSESSYGSLPGAYLLWNGARLE